MFVETPASAPWSYQATLRPIALLRSINDLTAFAPAGFWPRTTTRQPVAGSNYSPYEGFQLDTTGQPIAAAMTLPVGQLIDRFGSEYGSYASLAADPFMQRALPPSNLDTHPENPLLVTRSKTTS